MIKVLDRVRSDVDKIRNVCILAHVDHGKTSLSDSLVSINGIISSNSAGKLHYLDNREDEQTRFITIKSSSISIVYTLNEVDYLINLVDSPGHVDFSVEVSAAVRMCDGALFVVDSVEGVCPQSKIVLRQAFREGVRPVLVLNKVDRLITELRLTPLEVYHRLENIVGQANALVYNITSGEEIDAECSLTEENGNFNEDSSKAKNDYYNPSKGNVVFCSAIHRWAVNLEDFALFIAKKLGSPPKSLDLIRESLWGDFYYSHKDKTSKICKNEETPMFVEFVIKQIYTVYNVTMMDFDKQKVDKIMKYLNIDPVDLKGEALLVHILNKWIPLSKGLADIIVRALPDPRSSLSERLSVISPSLDLSQIKEKNTTLVHIAKFVACDFTTMRLTGDKLRGNERPGEFVALARVFNGTLSTGLTLYIKNQPVRVVRIFLCMGADLIPISEGFQGNILALQIEEHDASTYDMAPQVKLVIEWLYRLRDPQAVRNDNESHRSLCSVERCLTLYSVPNLQSLPMLNGDMVISAILRVSIEPVNIKDMEQFLYGLALLYTADQSVEIDVLNTGEYVLGCCGEMHLERCLNDLKHLYAMVDIRVSEQLISIREGVLSTAECKCSKTELIPNTSFKVPSDIAKFIEYGSISGGEIEIIIRAVTMPQAVLDLLDKKVDQYRRIVQHHDSVTLIETMENEILSQFDAPMGKIWGISLASGSRTLLIYAGDHSSVEWSLLHSYCQEVTESNFNYQSRLIPHFISAFQVASRAGPLALEPLRGVIFIIHGIAFNTVMDSSPINSESSSQHSWALCGQIMSSFKQLLHRCIKAPIARIYQPTLKVDLLCEDNMLGCVYSILSMYKAQIINESNQGHLFLIEALLSVSSSLGLSKVIRSKSSGSISYNIAFYKWIMLDQDPFNEPCTARTVIDSIRTTKGLRPHVYQDTYQDEESS